jgi:hypothetical protein
MSSTIGLVGQAERAIVTRKSFGVHRPGVVSTLDSNSGTEQVIGGPTTPIDEFSHGKLESPWVGASEMSRASAAAGVGTGGAGPEVVPGDGTGGLPRAPQQRGQRVTCQDVAAQPPGREGPPAVDRYRAGSADSVHVFVTR